MSFNKEQLQKEKANMESALQQIRVNLERLQKQELLQIGAVQTLDHLISLLDTTESKEKEELKKEKADE